MNPSTYCIIHCRVSTARQAREGDSLETHAGICRALAERNGWELAHEPWLEAHTGSSSTRPVFDDVLAFLDQNPGMVRYYLFRSIDRFTRGGVDLYNSMKRELRQRGVEPVDSMGIIQPGKNTLEHLGFEYEWSRTDPSEISELVVATQAKTEKTTILTRMIGQGIALAQKGYCVRQAADGYKLQRVSVDGKRRHIQIAHPDRAKFYIAMLELRAAGDLSDKEIATRINAIGYRTRSFERWNADKSQVIGHGGGRPLTVKQLQRIVQNPIYCGVVYEKWTHWKPIRAPYPGLVSIETFNAANRGKRFIRENDNELELLHDYYPYRQTRVYSRINPQFPFKNVIMCPACHKPFHASASRGKGGRRFPAYHCQRTHERIGINKQAFEEVIHRFVGGVRFDGDVWAATVRACRKSYREREVELVETRAAIRRTTADLETQKAEAVKAFLSATSDVMRKALEEEVVRLEREIASASGQKVEAGVSKSDLDRYLEDVRDILEHPQKLLENPANVQTQRSHYLLVFDQLPTISELDFGTPKLTHIFWVCSDLEGQKSLLAGQPGISWNSIHPQIKEWKKRQEQQNASAPSGRTRHPRHEREDQRSP